MLTRNRMKIAGTSLRPLEVWRADVSREEARDFARSLAASFVRAGSGARAVSTPSERPTQALVLYEKEGCPFSRLVREALSDLDLDAWVKPCTEGERAHHAELQALASHTHVPFLWDRAADKKVGDSQQIVEYLYERYGSGAVPPQLRARRFALLTSRLASRLRGGEHPYQAPARVPDLPLELWNYEASPYCRLVRERLGELGLAYISHNLARRSPRRAAFRASFGRLQFPRLDDPNTSTSLFETRDIIAYLDQTYASSLSVIAEVAQPHLM